jgi:hypothetical protein
MAEKRISVTSNIAFFEVDADHAGASIDGVQGYWFIKEVHPIGPSTIFLPASQISFFAFSSKLFFIGDKILPRLRINRNK